MTASEHDRQPAADAQAAAEPPGTQQPPAAPPPPAVVTRRDEHDRLTRSARRLSSFWLMLVVGVVVLVLLLVFILQNSQHIEVHLYGAHWNAPVGVALLMAAALGVLLVVIPGATRVLQLRRAAHRARRHTAEPEMPAPARGGSAVS